MDKAEIVANWLPRYTGMSLDRFGKYIILTNFKNYIENFSELMGAVKVFDLADLLSQVTVLKKKVPTPLLKLALGIIIFAIKRYQKRHS